MKHLEYVKTASPLTLRAYGRDLAQAFPHEKLTKTHRIGSDQELMQLCRQAQMSWSQLSAASRNRKTATLKSFLHYLFQQGVLTKDLRTQLIAPSVPKKIPNFLSVDEALVCLQSFRSDVDPEQSRKERVLFLLLYGSGLRVSEACQLRWKQVDLHQSMLRVRGKGDKERFVPLPSTSCQALLEFKAEAAKQEFVFGNSALDTRTAYAWIRRRGQIAGLLKPLHPHALRHSYATHLLTSGANLRVLQELLGHANLQATEKYTHLSLDSLARTMNQMHPLRKGNW